MKEHDVLRRAALAVVRSTDYEATFHEAQSPVDDWALAALHAAVTGNLREAEILLDRYERADWEVRRAYAITDWSDECPPAARAATAS